jgi:hypothetical protein
MTDLNFVNGSGPTSNLEKKTSQNTFQKVSLVRARLPNLQGKLLHSNQFLKIFAFLSLLTSLVLTVVLGYFLMKPPRVLTFNNLGTPLSEIAKKSPESEIQSAAAEYIENRYIWTPSDIVSKFGRAKDFVQEKDKAAFDTAVAEVTKFVAEKSVSQRIYPSSLEVSLKQGLVRVSGERITTVQGLKAASDLKLELTFVSGDRTDANPWGIYIIKEREEKL